MCKMRFSVSRITFPHDSKHAKSYENGLHYSLFLNVCLLVKCFEIFDFKCNLHIYCSLNCHFVFLKCMNVRSHYQGKVTCVQYVNYISMLYVREIMKAKHTSGNITTSEWQRKLIMLMPL